MDRILGPNLEISLWLREGRNLDFVGTNFKIVASLDNNAIETNYLSPGSVVCINSELIWASSKEHIKKMRSYKVPIRLDFYKEGSSCKKPFGYIILNLKWAQYLSREQSLTAKEETYKLCGTSKEAAEFMPFIIAALRIHDANSDICTSRTIDKKSENTKLKMSNSVFALNPSRHPISLPSARLLGTPLETKKSDEMITNAPGCGDNNNCVNIVQNFVLIISLKDCNWNYPLTDVHFRFHHSKSEISWTAHEDIKETYVGLVTDVTGLVARLVFVETSVDLDKVLTIVPPTLSLCTLKNGRPNVLGTATLAMPTVLSTSEIRGCAQIKDLQSEEALATIYYSAQLINNGAQQIEQLPILGDQIIGERIKDELEAWKETQRLKLQQEYEDKLKQELMERQAAYTSREAELEKQFADRMEISFTLSEELRQAMDALQIKEKCVENSRIQLKSDYAKLITETKRETKILREELIEQLKDKDNVINELQNHVDDLSAQLKSKSQPWGDMTSQQIETLIRDLKTLQEKLEKANESKTFFKEQWSRAVQELHRIKSKGLVDIPVNLNFRKKHLQQLGLQPLQQNIIPYDSQRELPADILTNQISSFITDNKNI